MKILCTGDWHIRATNPRYRIDSYSETMMEKLKWIFALAKEKGCSIILQPGDFFDSPDQSNKVEIELIKLLRDSYCPVSTVLGQHDCKFRNRNNVALQKFGVDNLVNIASDIPYSLNTVHIYGASWEEEIPTVNDKNAKNILITHRMITQDGPLWHDQQDYITAKEMLRKYADFDTIVSGDNHQSFMATSTTEKKQGSVLLNCGSLMRTTIAQREHRPCVYIYDVDLHSYKQHFIPINPIEEVMNLELADELKERNEALEAFMTGLSSEYKVDLSFEDNLTNLMKANEVSREVQGIAYTMVGKWYEQNKGDK
jgi:DNA repair protein SbcD/Mre11